MSGWVFELECECRYVYGCERRYLCVNVGVGKHVCVDAGMCVYVSI